ncbi:MAG: UbiA family prenyltransferase [Candidatus Micrarchaeia archaeon]
MYSKIVAILKLTRIEHSIMLIVAVLAAEIIAKGLPSYPVLALSIITPIFISMASFAINDYFDIEVDKANGKKNRPLVNGSLKPKDAVAVTVASLAIGFGASYFINIYCFAIAIAFGLLAVLYAYMLKEKLLVGNMYVAFSMAIPFVFGNYVVSNTFGISIILISTLIFFSGLAREIQGTIRDLKGDMLARNAKTLPKVIGITKSAIISLVFYLLSIAISLYLFVAVEPFRYNIAYITLISITDIILVYIGIGYIRKRDGKFYALARNASLAAMSLALFAILIAPLI